MKNKMLLISSYFIFMFGCVLFCTENVQAYIDPSVMTYAIQAIAGVIIAIGAFIGIFIRKAKRKISKKLGVDENRNKEIEDDNIIVKNKKK